VITRNEEGEVVEVLAPPAELGGKVTNGDLVHLKELTYLQVLDLEETQVTDAGVAELKQALPNCVIFN